MNGRINTSRHAMIMARIAAVVVAFVFAHELMMVVQPMPAMAESHHHEVMEVQECATTDGLVHVFTGPPLDQPIANLTPAGEFPSWASVMPAAAVADTGTIDASTRRAMLQVFLN